MRIALVSAALVAAALVGCASSSGGAAADPWAKLTVTYWDEGRKGETKPLRWTLRCGPAGGTLPKRAAVCKRLDATKNAFAPIRKDVACTEIYGGPGEVVVSGTFRDRRIWALFTRRDGCQIGRWNDHAFLWGQRGGAAP